MIKFAIKNEIDVMNINKRVHGCLVACQLPLKVKDGQFIPKWVNYSDKIICKDRGRGCQTFEVETPNGKLTAMSGDYIVCNDQDECYVCDAKSFELMYKKVDEDDVSCWTLDSQTNSPFINEEDKLLSTYPFPYEGTSDTVFKQNYEKDRAWFEKYMMDKEDKKRKNNSENETENKDENDIDITDEDNPDNNDIENNDDNDDDNE